MVTGPLTTTLFKKPGAFLFLVLVSLIILPLHTSGCYGRRELEDMSIATIVGVDKGEFKPLLVTTVIALPSKALRGGMGGGGGGGEDTQATLILSAEGNTFLDALTQVTTMTSRLATTAHTQLVIIGEDIARKDAGVILDVFSRNLEFRHNTLVTVSRGRAVEFIREFKSPEEAEPSEYLVKLLLSCNLELGICPLISVHDFLIAYDTSELEPWAPYFALASTSPADEKDVSEGRSSNQKSKDGTSSEKQDTTIVTILGAAVFKKTGSEIKMVGVLDTRETMGVNILRGDFKRGYMEIAMPNQPDKHTTLAFHHLSTSVRTSKQADVVFAIRFTASVEETTARELDVSPEYHEKVVRTAEREMESLLTRSWSRLQAFDSDVTDLGMTVRKHFKTLQEWDEFDWPSKFKGVRAGYDVRISVLTSGFTFSPPSPR